MLIHSASKSFQNKRPGFHLNISVLQKLVAQPPHALDPRLAVRTSAQLLANAADMHIDTTIEPGQGTVERLLGNVLLADQLSGMPREHFQQAELRAGEFQ